MEKIAGTSYVIKIVGTTWQQVKLRIPLVLLIKNLKKDLFSLRSEIMMFIECVTSHTGKFMQYNCIPSQKYKHHS
jgi:hypothetical protein